MAADIALLALLPAVTGRYSMTLLMRWLTGLTEAAGDVVGNLAVGPQSVSSSSDSSLRRVRVERFTLFFDVVSLVVRQNDVHLKIVCTAFAHCRHVQDIQS